MLFTSSDGIEDAIGQVPEGELDVIANYTAFQQIRAVLGRTD